MVTQSRTLPNNVSRKTLLTNKSRISNTKANKSRISNTKANKTKANKTKANKTYKKNFILDIDNTLIHTEVNKVGNRMPDFSFVLYGDTYNVYKRPHVDEFLERLFKVARTVSVWSMGIKTYVNIILENLMTPRQIRQLKFVKTRSTGKRVVGPNGMVYSDVKIMSDIYKLPGFTVGNTVLIDDNEHHGLFSEGVLKVRPYFSFMVNDYYLRQLIRKIEKGKYKVSTKHTKRTKRTKRG